MILVDVSDCSAGYLDQINKLKNRKCDQVEKQLWNKVGTSQFGTKRQYDWWISKILSSFLGNTKKMENFFYI